MGTSSVWKMKKGPLLVEGEAWEALMPWFLVETLLLFMKYCLFYLMFSFRSAFTNNIMALCWLWHDAKWFSDFYSWAHFSFCFSKELKCVRTNLLSRASILVPQFVCSKLTAFLMFMSYALTGHPLASETIFPSIAYTNVIMHVMTLRFPVGILLLAELRVTVARIQVIRILGDQLMFKYNIFNVTHRIDTVGLIESVKTTSI